LVTNCNRLPQSFALGDRSQHEIYQKLREFSQISVSDNALIPVFADVFAIPENLTKLYKNSPDFIGCVLDLSHNYSGRGFSSLLQTGFWIKGLMLSLKKKQRLPAIAINKQSQR